MRRKELINKGQSIVEYIAVIIVVIAVFIAIWKYYQRGLQGKFRQAGDVIGGGEQAGTFKFNLQ
jgi:hypothetical protein